MSTAAARLDPAIGFWLRYVAAQGGLAEAEGETHLAVLPESVRAESGFGELVHVTGDPDIARENAAVLLGPGHPALSAAADRVLAVGDVGALALDAARPRPPDAETLLEKARDQFPIDHGRIFTTGSPGPASRTLLRIGALVTYALSADEHYQEQVEYWIDVESRLPLSAAGARRLAAAEPAPPRAPGSRPSPERLAAVLVAARELIDQGALRRRAELAAPARNACVEEQRRAEDYYAAQIKTLRQRLEALPEEKQAAYRARIEATGAERERRLAEIGEKYAPQHDVRPFRAHLVRVPCVHLPAEARRGERRHALRFDYLTAAGEYAGIRCPACSSTAALVLAKTGFGCEQCVGRPKTPDSPPQKAATRHTSGALPAQRAAAEPAMAVPATAEPAGAKQAVRTPGTRAAPARPRPKPASKTPPPASRRAQARTGVARRSSGPDQRVFELWQAVANGDRAAVDELCEPHSPAAASVRLYGPGGLLASLQLPVTDSPTGVSGEPYGRWRGRNAFAGTVDVRSGYRVFMLTWSDENPPRVEELLPSEALLQPRVRDRADRRTGADRRAPEPRVTLDPVARHLWAVMLSAYDMHLPLRALAALWRLEDAAGYLARYDARTLAAALDRLVGYWSQAPGATYAEAAARYGVAESAVRAAGAALHKELKLTRQRPW